MHHRLRTIKFIEQFHRIIPNCSYKTKTSEKFVLEKFLCLVKTRFLKYEFFKIIVENASLFQGTRFALISVQLIITNFQ